MANSVLWGLLLFSALQAARPAATVSPQAFVGTWVDAELGSLRSRRRGRGRISRSPDDRPGRRQVVRDDDTVSGRRRRRDVRRRRDCRRSVAGVGDVRQTASGRSRTGVCRRRRAASGPAAGGRAGGVGELRWAGKNSRRSSSCSSPMASTSPDGGRHAGRRQVAEVQLRLEQEAVAILRLPTDVIGSIGHYGPDDIL